MAITTITKEMVSVNAIQGTLIADNAITAVHIATNAVSGTLIADNAVTATHIAQNTITVTQLADDCVESAKIADGIITTNHLNKAMISSQTEVAVATGDFVLIGDTSDSNNLKKAPISSILAGTLTTAAQTNITSLGTLTGLTVDGATTTNALKGGSTNFDIYQTTSDGSDNRRTRIGGGGDVAQSRGAFIELAGNEHSDTGDLILNAGDVSGGDIILKTDNTNRIFVKDDGNVGINVSNPGHILEVSGDIEFSKAGNGNNPIMHVIDTADTECAWFEGRRAGDTGAFISLWHNPSSAAGTNRAGIKFHAPDAGGNKTNYAKIMMEIDSNSEGSEDGQLGFHLVHDGSEQETFTIKKERLLYKGRSSSAFIRCDNRADGHDTGFEIYQNGNRKWELYNDDSNTGAFEIRPDGASGKYTFMQNGKFGIGTASPAATLHIDTSTNSPLLVQSTYGTGGYIELKVSDNTSAGELTGFIGDSEALISSGTAGDFAIRAQESFVVSTGGATQKFEIESGGLVLIGDASQESGDLESTKRLYLEGGESVAMIKNTSANGSSNRVSIGFLDSGGTRRGYIYTNNSTADMVTSSDYRMKENVTPMVDGLSRVNALKPVKFKWKHDDYYTEGFLAHEVQEAGWNEGVTGEKDGEEMQAVSYGRITPLLVKAIQELSAKNDDLKARIKTLEDA